MKPKSCARLLCLAVLGLVGCAQGGGKDTPQAAVSLSENHHIWAASTLPQFSVFPVMEQETLGCRGSMTLMSDSSYDISFEPTPGCSSQSTGSYFLDADGALSILVVPSASSGPIEFRGAYGLQGDTGVYYFTDQFTSAATNPLALFWGTRIAAAVPDLEGAWHVFTQEVVFSSSLSFSPSNVARSLAGTVAIDAAGGVLGTGVESTKVSFALSGLANGFADGEVALTLDFTDPQATDMRSFVAGAGTAAGATAAGIVLGIDLDNSTGEAGLIALLRQRTGAVDPALFAGQFYIGMQTVLIDPGVRRTTIGHGTLEFNATGGFMLDVERVGPAGLAEPMSYDGTYTLADDGTLELSIPAINETWAGAVDQEYNTVVLLDNVGENPHAEPEISIALALRRVVTPP